VPATPPVHLSRRERQIMDIVYTHNQASVKQVLAEIPDAPGRTAVRTLMRILEEKGHLKHKKKSREFIYQAVQPRSQIGRSEFRRVLKIFFNGSLEKAVSAYLSESKLTPSAAQLKRLSRIIHAAQRNTA